MYYDINEYMLAIDGEFNLYQFTELNWKTTPLNTNRGANASKVQDLLYDNDGKMYGLVFNPDAFMVQIMKQSSAFYLSPFATIESQLSPETSTEFVMTDQSIIKCKIGSITDYNKTINEDDETDNDPNFAYQKQTIENQAKLRAFCAVRSSSTGSSNYDNYDLLANVEQNADKISKLKNIIKNLVAYEPDKTRILDNNSIMQ